MSSQALAISAVVVITASGCASTVGRPDDALLMSRENSAVLVIAPIDGVSSLKTGSSYFSLPGYLFLDDEILLHPGRHRIHFACPGDWEWQNILHFVPWVDATFKAGKSYELRCENGYPKILELPG